MGTSVLLVFIAPFLAIYALFVGVFSEFAPKPQAEIILPYNESQGLVWKYEEQEDYYIDLVEERIDGNKQIFVFEDKRRIKGAIGISENKINFISVLPIAYCISVFPSLLYKFPSID